MLVLWEREQVSVGELRDCLYLDLGTLSPLLKRMEKAGHITRQRDASDERRVLIRPTEHGHSLYEAARAIPEALVDQIGVTQSEVERLRDEARSLITRLATVTAANNHAGANRHIASTRD
jgi:DNA-binding MarR family transcriptional regulator